MPMFGQQGGGFFPAFQGMMNQYGDTSGLQKQQAAEIDQMVLMQQLQGQIAEAERANQARAQQRNQQLGQALDQWELRNELPENLQNLFDVDQATAIKQAFPDRLTADQAADNAREDARFAFEQQKYANKMKLDQTKLGQFSEPEGRFYVQEIGKIDRDYGDAKQRFDSAIASLGAGNATGDKAALVHLARLISNEALNEDDVKRNVSEGVMPSYFETAWNTVAGKGELTPEARKQMMGQFQRELSSKFDAYSAGYDRIAGSIRPDITAEERRRVLQQKRTPTEIAQEKARVISTIDPASVTTEMADSMTEEELAALPFDTIVRLQQELEQQEREQQKRQRQAGQGVSRRQARHGAYR